MRYSPIVRLDVPYLPTDNRQLITALHPLWSFDTEQLQTVA